jgi:hypothetical protein
MRRRCIGRAGDTRSWQRAHTRDGCCVRKLPGAPRTRRDSDEVQPLASSKGGTSRRGRRCCLSPNPVTERSNGGTKPCARKPLCSPGSGDGTRMGRVEGRRCHQHATANVTTADLLAGECRPRMGTARFPPAAKPPQDSRKANIVILLGRRTGRQIALEH